jgi:4-alpha-glucanotransferase
MGDEAVRELAAEAGILNNWIDATDQPQRVGIESLRTILSALGYPCGTDAELADSRARLRSNRKLAPMVTAKSGTPVHLSGLRADRDRFGELLFEQGARASVRLQNAAGGSLTIGPVEQPGYHRLRIGTQELVLAVAP